MGYYASVPGAGTPRGPVGRGDTEMRDLLYKVTGTIMGKRITERAQTLEEARAIVCDLDTGNIWYLSVLGRVRVETRKQAVRNSEKGGTR